MRELSLFTGAGGGLLGTHLLGWTPIGYVEFNDYCQRVIRQRIIDGILPSAPIFGDIRAFISSGCAELYRGITDVITAGFPCQPFSVAGDMEAEGDDRNMWPEAIDVVGRVRPKLVFFENVPGMLSSGYGFTVTSELQRIGYQVLPPLILGAIDVGAPHKRDRVWIVAYSSIEGVRRLPIRQGRPQQASTDTNGMGEDVSNTKCYRRDEMEQPIISRTKNERPAGSASDRCIPGWGDWWQAEPDVGRVVDRMAHRVDRLRAIGNGQVPAVAATAWQMLIGGV